jgi:integrase/ribosomal protein L40E
MAEDIIDIHFRQKRLNNLETRLTTNDTVLEENKQLLLKYIKFCKSQDMSISRTEKIGETLFSIMKIIKKPINDFESDDITELMLTINNNWKNENTNSDFKKIFKKFYYKFLKGFDDYPSEAKKLIRYKTPSKKLKAGDLLTIDERKALLSVCNLMYRALILSMIERGIEIGAILPCRVSDVRFDEGGCWMQSKCKKTKYREREIRLINSVPALREWLDVLKGRYKTEKEFNNSPLWLDQYNNPLKYQAFRRHLQKLGKIAGIKKRLYPHLLRHIGITQMILDGIPESIIKMQVGHSLYSNELATYTQLASSNIDDALQVANGNAPKKKDNGLKKKVCLKCKQENSPELEYCSRCGSILDPEKLLEIQESRLETDTLLGKVIKNKEKRDQLFGLLDWAKAQRQSD